jgi:hypothetical protein
VDLADTPDGTAEFFEGERGERQGFGSMLRLDTGHGAQCTTVH